MRCLVLLLAFGCLLQAGLTEVKNERNPERRAVLAMENAKWALRDAQDAYAKGDNHAVEAALAEMQTSIDLAREALASTGKSARKNPGPFKRAETESRALLRRLEGLEQAMASDDRGLVEGPKAKVQEVHDKWLEDLFSKK